MSAAHGSANGADGLLRRTVHRRMEREMARLEAAGTPVICLEPGPRGPPRHGAAGHGRGPQPRVIEAAYEETRASASSPRPFLATLGEPGTCRLRRLSPGRGGPDSR